MSLPMDIAGNGMQFPGYIDTGSHYDGSTMSVEEHMDSATIDPKTTFGANIALDERDFPVFDSFMDPMGAAPNDMSLLSPTITTSEDPYEDMQSLLANTHAAPWNPTIPRSTPYDNARSLQIPGQPKHQFMSLPNHFGGYSFDSAYVSQPPAADTMSFVSAPSAAMYSCNDDASDIMDRPTKKAKKTFHCDLPGEHRTRDFANIHDLERHQRSTHGIKPRHSQSHYYRCTFKDCRNKPKTWDRKDNFRSHIVRKHFPGRNAEQYKSRIDEYVKMSQVNLSQNEIDRIFAQKQRAKENSRQTASKRRARKSSSRLDIEAAERVRSTIGSYSGNNSTVASAIDDVEYMSFQQDDGLIFSPDAEPLLGMTPTSHPAYMTPYTDAGATRPTYTRDANSSSSSANDFW
ncbi:hypothetical protein CAC42_5102 [Sphaceloma murrayae]|uniref:C2H2-type domain-containing protein n=1 Tax=Sphaceloma murrayae TaxID=2082308 RepID=A0A2K1QUK7_9PEZI|nr:hypothetical protein CAC42_5102 [Sphaceloma murrayae]